MDIPDARATPEWRGWDRLPETGGVAAGVSYGSLLGSTAKITP